MSFSSAIPSTALRRSLLVGALLSLIPAIPAGTPAQARAANATSAIPAFAYSAFSTLWERTDALVADGSVKRTWFWGPQPNSEGLLEEYKEGDAGKRVVQYFDKSRMEINDPAGDPANPFYITNGLLTVELLSGRLQTGKDSFQERQPSRINVTGDAEDTLAPTYAELAPVSNAGQDRRNPDRTGQAATATLGRGSRLGDDPSKASVPGVKIAYYEKTTGHNIPQVMWDFLNSMGPVRVGGKVAQARLIEPWFYASGLPISDPYWVRATIAGKPTDVLIQAYERRVLTYVPTNPEGFRVEMGNIGQHYYQWRYVGEQKATPVPAQRGSATPTSSQGTSPVPTSTQAATPALTPTAVPTQQASPTPTPRSAIPATLSRFAVDLVGDTSPNTLDRIKALGAGAVRLYTPWGTIESSNLSPDQYNWTSTDAVLRAASERGLQVIAIIDGCPTWACSRPEGPIRGERVGDFVEFTTALVQRYSKPPYNIQYWEFWNEPDSTSTGQIKYNWGTYGARYAEMLKAVRPGMKAADPAAQLVMGGVAYDNFQEGGGPFYRRFVDDVLDAGGGQYMDVFNFHYYVQNIHWCSFTAKLNELRDKLKARNLNLPIISTETGFTSQREHGSSDDMQSLYVAQSYAQAAGEGMMSATWFSAKDGSTNVPGGGDIFLKSGLINQDGAPKPSYNAYRMSITELGQRPPVRALDADEGITGKMRGYEFGSDSAHPGKLWVVWAWDLSTNRPCGSAPAPRDFTIPSQLGPNVKRILDMYGHPVPTRRSGNSIIFSLDARPVYIEWTR